MTVKKSPKAMKICDFDYRKWFFSLFVMIAILFSSFGPSISAPPPSDVCSQLTDNFRFDFALNQHIAMSFTSVRATNNHDYRHYLVSKHRLYRFSIPGKSPVISMQPIAAQETLDSIPYDIGFSLWAWPVKEAATRLCFLKYLKSSLTCINLDHYNRRNMDQIEPIRNHNIKHYKFSLPASYYPTVAYQDVRFTQNTNSMYRVTFLEQKLIMIPNSSSNSYYFERHYRLYMFERMDRIVDLTESHVIPDFLEQVPVQYEITGVFNWWENGYGEHEYLILVFNGTNHLYCQNEDCSRAEDYKPYLVECRPSFEIDPKKSKPVLAIDHSRLNAEKNSCCVDLTNQPYPIYILSGIVFVICCLGLLILAVYCCSKQKVRRQKKKEPKKVFLKSIRLSQLSAKVGQMDGGDRGQDDEDGNVSPSSPSLPNDVHLQSVISTNESTGNTPS